MLSRICVYFLLIQALAVDAQFTSLRDIPAFSMYGDNYFTTGTTLADSPTHNNSDVKFQIGFKHRITNMRLPLGTYLFLTYQQKSFWNIYKESAPFRESNYNPGLALGKAIIRNRELFGAFYLEVEHESNGKGGLASRSWNKVSFNSKWCLTPDFRLDVSVWLPFLVDQEANPDLTDYIGYQKIGLSWRWHPRLFFDLDTQAAFGDVLRGQVTAGLFFQHTRSTDRFIYLQVFHGYAEELFSYNVIRTRGRVGIAFRHDFFNLD